MNHKIKNYPISNEVPQSSHATPIPVIILVHQILEEFPPFKLNRVQLFLLHT